jgi:hypothetical protein
MTRAMSNKLPDSPPALVRTSRSKKMAVSEPVPIPLVTKKVRVKKSPAMKDSSDGSSDTAEKKRENKWLNEVRKYRESNPTCSYKDALKGAKEHYKR